MEEEIPLNGRPQELGATMGRSMSENLIIISCSHEICLLKLVQKIVTKNSNWKILIIIYCSLLLISNAWWHIILKNTMYMYTLRYGGQVMYKCLYCIDCRISIT